MATVREGWNGNAFCGIEWEYFDRIFGVRAEDVLLNAISAGACVVAEFLARPQNDAATTQFSSLNLNVQRMFILVFNLQ